MTAADGTTAEYDRLLVATGSMPFVVPIPGATLPGVVTYRDLDDVNKMLEAAGQGGHAVVIGGGLLGLEAAAGLKAQGMEVTVLHLMPTLMERQLDPSSGYLLQKAFEDRGIAVRCKANTHAILGETHVTGVRLDDGTELAADIVVMAVGIRPNAALAKEAGLETNRGVLVGDDMRTSDPDVFSVGECVEHRGLCYGLVAPLYEMAKVVAAQLAGDEAAAYTGSVTATKLKVTGIDLFSAGDFGEAKDRQDIVLRDAARGVYKRLVLKENRIVGAVLYGETGDGSWFFDLLRKEADVSELRDTLIFGQSYVGGAPLDPTAAVAALPDDAEICGCNGVCKGKIVQAITDKGLSSLAEVRAHTKASASCGTCTGLVEQVMTLTLGDKFAKSAVEPMCGCTDLGHDDVRRLIRAAELKSIPAVMQELGWKSSCGCAKCRPALNYYLLCDWPEEYEDDGRSRFVNERVHANIQKDGTYSVVPRMWGGLDEPAGAARHRGCGRALQHPDREGHGRAAHRSSRRAQGGSAGGLGRSQRCRHGLRPCLCQGPAHGEDLRRHGLVPLRHAGFHRPRRQDREVHVGVLDTGEGQDGRLRLSAELRGIDLQGCGRDLRRFRLRDPFCRCGRPPHQGHATALQGPGGG